jgi:Fur family ferric uptake transcriptional regulator
MTRQRRVILEELRKAKTHPSADEIYTRVRKRLPRISLGTIYRNLELLSASGEVKRIDSGSHVKRFDGRADDHYHIRCLKCDRLVDTVFYPGVDLDECVKGVTDFTIIGHKLEFVGICPNCQHPPADASNSAAIDPPV